MKRFIFLIIFTCLTAWIPMACSHTITGPVPSVPSPAPTTTSTPVCGTPTSVAIPSLIGVTVPYVTPGAYVIQSAAQWSATNTNYNQPSVNFTTQMVLEYTQTMNVSCMCSLVEPVITSVCFYPDHIQVTGTKPGSNCPPPGGPTCYSIITVQAMVLVAVPQSNLPVVWNMQ